MAAISKHPADVANWIESVIESCTTVHQVIATHKLIHNWKCMYHTYASFYTLYDSMLAKAEFKWQNILLNEDRNP